MKSSIRLLTTNRTSAYLYYDEPSYTYVSRTPKLLERHRRYYRIPRDKECLYYDKYYREKAFKRKDALD